MKSKVTAVVCLAIALFLVAAPTQLRNLGPGACIAAAPSAAQATVQKTYIEFILDASISMTARVEGWKSRMDVAKEVTEQFLKDLPDDPSLFIALRVYGAELVRDAAPCDDSVLVHGFKPVAGARKDMIATVRSIDPKGMTPIAYSLQLAAKDFPNDPDARKIVILVTDGAESCGGDPCAVSKRLQEQGLMLKPYVVGFALADKEVDKVRCIGEFYTASDTATLKKALGLIMAQAVSPSFIEVKAWGDGKNVTAQTEIQVFKSSGEPVTVASGPQGSPVARAQVEEGQYTVRGRYLVGPEALVAEKTGVVVKPGQTTLVDLDFGALGGRLRVTARASGQDVSNNIDIQVLKGGLPAPTQWTGVPPVASLSAGDYTLAVTHKQYTDLARVVPASVMANRQTEVTVDLGELPASLELRVNYRGACVARNCEVTLAPAGRTSVQLKSPSAGDVFRWQSAPGTVDITVQYRGTVSVEKTVRGVQLMGGITTPVTVDFSDVLGTLRARVMAAGQDVTAQSQAAAAGAPGRINMPLSGTSFEITTTPGAYMLGATYRNTESEPIEAYVSAGQITEAILNVSMPGMIALIPSVSGKAVVPSRVSAWASSNGMNVGQFIAQPDRLEISLPEGAYTVTGEVSDPFRQTRDINNVQVKPGVTTEVRMDFDPAGTVRIKVLADGKPMKNAGVAWIQGDNWQWLDTIGPGVFEAKLAEGAYDFEIHPNVDGMRNKIVRDIVVVGGGVIEKEITMGGTGTIRVKVTADGKPMKNAGVAWIQGDDWRWVDMTSPGVFEAKLAEGAYDFEIYPNADGMKDRIMRGIEVVAGSTVEHTVVFGAPATVRVTVTAAGKAFNDVAIFVLNDDGDTECYMDELGRGRFECKLVDGTYDICIEPYDSDWEVQILRGVQVKSGDVVDLKASLVPAD